ncbi:hypothetical protein HDV64DRAFT_275131 [Trichoderma sp. TUCIM 5745]
MSQQYLFYRSEGCDPSASSSEDFEYFFGIECAGNDASATYRERESFPPFITFSPSSEDENAGSTFSESEDSTKSQQDRFSGYGHHIPHSPITDPTHHPWEETHYPLLETQQQPINAIPVDNPATSSQDNVTSRPSCDICNESFSSKSCLVRHVKSTHEEERDYWICTVKGCRKYNKPVKRKDNIRRHYKKKHPTVDLRKLSL